jgi:hypothetical protein
VSGVTGREALFAVIVCRPTTSRSTVRTGRLIKFRRQGADVQAYLYREGNAFRASVFVLKTAQVRDEPLEILTGPTEALVEQELRAWVEAHYPEKP